MCVACLIAFWAQKSVDWIFSKDDTWAQGHWDGAYLPQRRKDHLWAHQRTSVSWWLTRLAKYMEYSIWDHKIQQLLPAGVVSSLFSPTWQKWHKMYLQPIIKKEGYAWHRRQEEIRVCLTEVQYVIRQIQCFKLLNSIICLLVIHWCRKCYFSFTFSLIPLPHAYF